MVPKGVRSNLRGWNFDMFVQSRGCTGCNPIPARWRRSYISLGHPETWSGSKSCRFVWIPYAPWCWYIHLHDWVILFGQMSVNIPAPWGIWGWCSLSFPLKHPFLGGFDYRRLQHPQGSPRWHWRLNQLKPVWILFVAGWSAVSPPFQHSWSANRAGLCQRSFSLSEVKKADLTVFVCVAGFSQCHFLCDRLFVLTFSHTEVFRKCRAVMFSLAFVIVFPASVGAMMSAGRAWGWRGLWSRFRQRCRLQIILTWGVT